MFKKDIWNLILINYCNPIPKEYIVSLEKIYNIYENNYYLVDKKIIKGLNQMFECAHNENINISIFSGYRDINKQIELVNFKINNYIQEGFNLVDARNKTFSTLSIPGYSEHHTGLAIDIYCNDDKSFDNTLFENTNAYTWLINNSYKFGFILRYPKEKENITNITFEPWHFRYVGFDEAKYIHNNNLCLEEFIEKSTI